MNLFAQTPDSRVRHPRRGAPRRRTPRLTTAHAAHAAHAAAHHPKPLRLEPLESRTLFSTGLDPLFGVGGRVRLDVANFADSAAAVHVLPDGRILVAGTATHGIAADLTPVTRPFVARLNPDGSLDATFGTAGVATTAPPPEGEIQPDVLNPRLTSVGAIAVAPDGRIFLGGTDAPVRPAGSPPPAIPPDPAFTVAAFSADGAPDFSFGRRGVTFFPAVAQPAGGKESVSAMVVQADGAVVATGAVRQAGADESHVVTVRFTAAGTPDLAFGAKLLHLAGDSQYSDTDAAVALQSDGKIVAMGKATQYQAAAFALGRYNPDGTPDASFGSNGTVVTPVPVPMYAGGATLGGFCDMLVRGDGSIVAAGKTGYFEVTLARYTPNGTLDAGFGGGDGLVEVRATYGNAGDLRHDPADNTVTVAVAHSHRPQQVTVTSAPVAGLARLSVGHSPGFSAHVARLDAAGAVLSEKTMAGSDVTGTEDVFALEVQPDGKLLALGRAYPTADNGEGAAWDQTADALVARLDPALFPAGGTPLPDPPVPPTNPNYAYINSNRPAFKAKTSITKGRFFKFELGYTSPELARQTPIGVYGPGGQLEAVAQLLRVRKFRSKTPVENPVRALASYRVGAPGGRFDASDNGQYTVRLGTAAAPPLGQVLGHFTVAAKARRAAPAPERGNLRRLNVPATRHLVTDGQASGAPELMSAAGAEAPAGQRVTMSSVLSSASTPRGGRRGVLVVTSIDAAAP